METLRLDISTLIPLSLHILLSNIFNTISRRILAFLKNSWDNFHRDKWKGYLVYAFIHRLRVKYGNFEARYLDFDTAKLP